MNCSINPRVSAPNSCTRVRGFNRAVRLYSNHDSNNVRHGPSVTRARYDLQVQRKLNNYAASARARRGALRPGGPSSFEGDENAVEILLFLPRAPPASCSTSGEGASTASALHDGPRRSLTPNCHSRSSHPLDDLSGCRTRHDFAISGCLGRAARLSFVSLMRGRSSAPAACSLQTPYEA